MTPLMHAAYKGDAESVDILITHGADVNKNSSQHGVSSSSIFIFIYKEDDLKAPQRNTLIMVGV